jgi:hypothetical protein
VFSLLPTNTRPMPSFSVSANESVGAPNRLAHSAGANEKNSVFFCPPVAGMLVAY